MRLQGACVAAACAGLLAAACGPGRDPGAASVPAAAPGFATHGDQAPVDTLPPVVYPTDPPDGFAGRFAAADGAAGAPPTVQCSLEPGDRHAYRIEVAAQLRALSTDLKRASSTTLDVLDRRVVLDAVMEVTGEDQDQMVRVDWWVRVAESAGLEEAVDSSLPVGWSTYNAPRSRCPALSGVVGSPGQPGAVTAEEVMAAAGLGYASGAVTPPPIRFAVPAQAVAEGHTWTSTNRPAPLDLGVWWVHDVRSPLLEIRYEVQDVEPAPGGPLLTVQFRTATQANFDRDIWSGQTGRRAQDDQDAQDGEFMQMFAFRGMQTDGRVVFRLLPADGGGALAVPAEAIDRYTGRVSARISLPYSRGVLVDLPARSSEHQAKWTVTSKSVWVGADSG